MNKRVISIFALLASLLVSACSNSDLESKLPDNRPDYRKSRTINTLEIPPDLTSSEMGSIMTVPAMEEGVSSSDIDQRNSKTAAELFEESSQNIHGSGDARWIEIHEKPSVVWDDVRDFWLANGLPLKRSDQEIGVMETDWLERAANSPRGSIQGLIDKVFGAITDSGERDKFRVRLDYYDDKTYVYLSHYQTTEEKLSQNDPTAKGFARIDDYDYTWVEGERNPELEMEMLRRISIYLNQESGREIVKKGESEKTNTNKLEMMTLADQTPALLIRESFNQSWVLLGIAIDRSGYTIKDRSREEGDYSIAKIVVKKSGIIFKSEEKTETNYHLRMSDQGENQIVVVQGDNGKPVSPSEAKSILQRISTEIKF